MPNLDLDKKTIPISDERVKATLGKSEISGNDLTTTISRLENDKSENPSEDNEYALNYLKSKVKGERSKIDGPKRAMMNTDGGGNKSSIVGHMNAFKKGTAKDGIGDIKPTGPAKLTSNGMDSKTRHTDMVNDPNKITYYESFESEIDSMRYLIEYMDNKKTKI